MRRPRELRPSNRYLLDRQAQRTLGDLMQEKAAVVAVCRRCKHRRLLLTPNMVERLGAGFRVLELRRILRCGQCRAIGMANLHETTR